MTFRPLASLRGRLGIGVIVILIFGVVSADLATFLIARQLFERRISENIELVTTRIITAGDTFEGEEYTSDSKSIVLTDPYIALYAPDGTLIFERNPLLPDGQVAPPIPSPEDLGQGIVEVETPGQSNGVVVQGRTLEPGEQFTFTRDGKTSAVTSLVVGLTSSRAAETFRAFVVAQIAVGTAILLIAIVGVLFLLRIGLRPLVRVARTAEEISAGDLSRRIPVADATTEIGAVSIALNAAFDNVERSEERMRSFVADASHELRTPLATIRGWADLYLSDGIREWSDVDTAMNRIRTESDRLADLVEQLLTLARLDAEPTLVTQRVDLDSLVPEVIALLAPQQHDHIIEYRISSDVRHFPEFMSDPALIRQILVNVLSNALRHTPAGTRVDIDFAAEPDGSHLRIIVRDDGPGMTTEQLARAYDRFWRAESGRGPTGGTGLGLSIVRASVLALGGTIDLESEIGQGLTIAIRIPSRRPVTDRV
jgi:two-component system, OmpR family, sensor kinase